MAIEEKALRMPKQIKPGDTLGVVAPSMPVKPEEREKLNCVPAGRRIPGKAWENSKRAVQLSWLYGRRSEGTCGGCQSDVFRSGGGRNHLCPGWIRQQPGDGISGSGYDPAASRSCFSATATLRIFIPSSAVTAGLSPSTVLC